MLPAPRAARPRCAVLYADLVGSRRLGRRRDQVQRSLRGVAATVNAELGPRLLSPFEIREGDAVRAVLRVPALLPDLFWRFDAALPAGSLRWAVGYGVLTTYTRFPDDADGPAYYAARDAQAEAARGPQPGVALSGFGAELDRMLSAAALLMGVLRRRLSAPQRRSITLLRELGTARAVAARLRVTPQAVGQQLRIAGWAEYAAAESACREVLGKFDASADWRTR